MTETSPRAASLHRKFPLAPSGKSPAVFRASLRPITRGVSRSSRTLGKGCDGRGGAARRSAPARTAKSCGLDASTLALTRQECFRILPGMVARKPDHQLLNAHIFCCGCRRRLILCWGRDLEGAMGEEIGLGRFGDRRLEKGGCRCTRRWYEGPVRVFDALLGAERGKFSSRAFCATRR
jgi:hypothetical protein